MATVRANLKSAAAPTSPWLGIHVDVPRAVMAGAIAGVIFLGLELAATAVLGERSPLGPAYVTLHGILGAEYAAGGWPLIVAALVLHFALAMALAVPLAALVHPWKDVILASAVGAVFGIALYFINFHVMGIFVPALANLRDSAMLINYAIFGACTVFAYGWLRRRRKG